MIDEIVYVQAHCHSRYSINKLSGEGVFHKVFWPVERQVMKALMISPNGLEKLAAKNNVRFVAVTDHNTVPSIKQGNHILIAGEEWGQSRGHANFIGLTEAIDPECGYFKNVEPEEPKSFFEASAAARKQGAFISINHPFKKDAWLWGDESYSLADAIEIWNGKWNQENQKALNLWQNLLINGSKIWCFAGNDFHVNHLFDISSQVLAMRNASTNGLLMENLRSGHFSIARDTDSAVIFLSANLDYKVENYAEGLELRTISANHYINELNPKEEGHIETERDDKFIRLELWKDNQPLSFTNPVFL